MIQQPIQSSRFSLSLSFVCDTHTRECCLGGLTSEEVKHVVVGSLSRTLSSELKITDMKSEVKRCDVQAQVKTSLMVNELNSLPLEERERLFSKVCLSRHHPLIIHMASLLFFSRSLDTQQNCDDESVSLAIHYRLN
jgi:hypothetical protein